MFARGDASNSKLDGLPFLLFQPKRTHLGRSCFPCFSDDKAKACFLRKETLECVRKNRERAETVFETSAAQAHRCVGDSPGSDRAHRGLEPRVPLRDSSRPVSLRRMFLCTYGPRAPAPGSRPPRLLPGTLWTGLLWTPLLAQLLRDPAAPHLFPGGPAESQPHRRVELQAEAPPLRVHG